MSDALVRGVVGVVIAAVVALIVIERFDSPTAATSSAPGTLQTSLEVGEPVDPANDPAAEYAPEPQPEIGRSQKARDQAADQLGYFPPAPSKAHGMTPEWAEYAATIDRVCGATYNYALREQARARQVSELRNWDRPRTEAALVKVWSHQGPRIQLAARKLGPPPKRAGLFERWLANVMTRSELFRRASGAAADGDFRRYTEICDRIDRLKTESDRLGQRFGLRICTSN